MPERRGAAGASGLTAGFGLTVMNAMKRRRYGLLKQA
jgi:hypothetical protein